MKTLVKLVLLIGFSQSMLGQTVVVKDHPNLSGNFLIAILAGVILALAFQFILTALSVAAGITAIGDVRTSFIKSSNHTGKSATDSNNSDDTFDQDYGGNTPYGIKITSAFGLWSLITTSIALFGGTAIAVHLSVYANTSVLISMALVIWALFFIILFYLEAKVVNTLIGGLINTAISGLRSSSKAIQSIFTPSKEEQIETTFSNAVSKIRAEFSQDIPVKQIKNTVMSFLNKANNSTPSYTQLKNDLKAIVSEAGSTNQPHSSLESLQKIVTHFLDKTSNDASGNMENKKKQVKALLSDIYNAYQDEGKTTDNLKEVAIKNSSLNKDQIENYIGKFKSFVSNAIPGDFDEGNLTQALSTVSKNPDLIKQFVSEKINGLSRKDIIALLNSNTNLEKNQIETYINKIWSISDKISDAANANYKKTIENKISAYLNSTERSALNYETLKDEFLSIMDNPSDSLSVIKQRLDTFDSNTIEALITNNDYIEKDQIDNLKQTIESAKQTVLDKVNTVEAKARQQLEMGKRKAVIKAENARKTAASAAWWLVGSAIFSGLASMVGALLLL